LFEENGAYLGSGLRGIETQIFDRARSCGTLSTLYSFAPEERSTRLIGFLNALDRDVEIVVRKRARGAGLRVVGAVEAQDETTTAADCARYARRSERSRPGRAPSSPRRGPPSAGA
jgi:hypothetical protein